MKKGTLSVLTKTFITLSLSAYAMNSKADIEAKQVDVIPIGVIAPTAQDAKSILKNLKKQETKVINGVSYTFGEIGKHNVVINISGVGKVNTAVATALLINNLHPQMLILSGSANSINQSVKTGDVFVSKQISANENIDPSKPTTYQVDKTILANMHMTTYLKKHPNVHMMAGNILTADAAPESSILSTDSTKQNFDVIDKESSAFAQVAWTFKVPYVVVRDISEDTSKSQEIIQQPAQPAPSKEAKAALPQAGLFVVNFIENISEDDLIVFSHNAVNYMPEKDEAVG